MESAVSEKKPIKIDLKIELTVPEVRMCDCGSDEQHAVIFSGDFSSMPFSSKYWGRGILQMEEVELFGEFIVDELRRQLEALPLPEKGPAKVKCLKHDPYAGKEVLFDEE
jgi:hypothetical protein